MEFDKTRVYTAVNADELEIGSKCIFADTVRKLKKKVEQKNNTNCIETFYRLLNNGGDDLFVGNDCAYCYAYLIEPSGEPPAEPKYKPFESVDKAMKAIKKHGGWIKSKDGNKSFFITGFNKKENTLCFVFEHWHSFSFLFAKFVWADDDSPCGELVEE
mgnify:CR=1 FL=1